MKTKLIIAMMALAMTAGAGIQTIDLTTRTTNTTAGSMTATVTNVFTNAVFNWVNPHSLSIGEDLASAFGKVGANFTFVEAQIGSNTAAIAGLTNAGSGSVSNLTPWTSDINAAGHSLTNSGTVAAGQLEVSGETFLNSFNLHIYAGVANNFVTDTNTITVGNTYGGFWTYTWAGVTNVTGHYNSNGFYQSKDFTSYYIEKITPTGNWIESPGTSCGSDYQCPPTNFPTGPWFGLFCTDQSGIYGTATNSQSANVLSSSNPLEIISTNGVRVVGSVDSSGPGAGFTVNGVPVTGAGGAGGIPTLNGFGTNTTIGFILTNTSYNPLLLVGTNTAVSGTNYYHFDFDTNSAAWAISTTPYPRGLDISNHLIGIWTNSATGPTNSIALFNITYLPTFGKFDSSYNIFIVTTNGTDRQFYKFDSPTGDWSGNADPPTGYGTPVSTNATFMSIIANGQFTPMAYQFVIPDGYSLVNVFSVTHGLGHTPHFVEWSYVCISPDSATGYQPGDGVKDNIDQEGNRFVDVKNSTTVSRAYYQGLMAGNGIWLTPKIGGSPTPISSQTNFLLQVEFYP